MSRYTNETISKMIPIYQQHRLDGATAKLAWKLAFCNLCHFGRYSSWMNNQRDTVVEYKGKQTCIANHSFNWQFNL